MQLVNKMVETKILAIQLKQIGDVLLTTPAIKALSESDPKISIDFLTQRPADTIYEHSPYVKKVWVLPPSTNKIALLKILTALRKEKYSAVIDFMGVPKTAFISRFTGAKQRVGFDFRARHWFYTHKIPYRFAKKYSVYHKFLLLEPWNLRPIDLTLRFQNRVAIAFQDKPKKQKTRWKIAVSPISRRQYKQWPAQCFAEVLRCFPNKQDCVFTLIGGPGEEKQLSSLQSLVSNQGMHLSVQVFRSLTEVWDFFQTQDIFFGNDNGLRHFAIASEIPSFAVFGQGFPCSWTPPNSSLHQTIENPIACKNHCVFPQCSLECIADITPQKVLQKLTQHLQTVYPSFLPSDLAGLNL